MRTRRALMGVGMAVSLLAATPLAAPAQPSSAVGTSPALALVASNVTAFYEMNEPAGTTVMTDSGPNGLNAAVNPTGVQSGVGFDGAVGYNWVHRPPEQAPPSPERIIQVPDNINLEPGNSAFTIELRYRSKENFGNITQKGQATSPGGQWKIQAPQGIPSCLFSGSAGQVATGAKTPLNDEQWHNLTCVLTSTGVTMYVDGAFRNRKNGPTGTIDNNIPMTVGGKINCDQIDITCDYFSGQIDYIKIIKGANQNPVANFTSSCSSLSCTFNPSSSSDDGSIVSYAWTFGDGATSTAASPTHAYPASGTYTARLTVTDNTGVTATITKQLTVQEVVVESPIAFVGSNSSAANTNRPTVTIPATAHVGDRLVLALSWNNLSRTVTTPTGWTQLDSVVANSMATAVWTKVVAPGDPGSSVATPLSGAAKYTITVADYTGVSSAAPTLTFARATDVSTTAVRLAPAVAAPLGSWVVSYWADKSGTTTAWTPDAAAVTTRRTACGADGGRICSALADSGEPFAGGTYPPVSATTGTASDMATMWSIVLPAADGPPANQDPVANFSSSCTLLDCDFTSSATDPDGTLASYDWDFGDGGGSTATNPSHSFAATGSYDVTLTVVDDDGASDAITKTVDVASEPVDSPVALVGSDATAGNTKTPTATVPAGVVAGDRLVMLLSINNVSRTVSAPTGVTGWTQLDSVVADTMGTTAWTKVAGPGDAGQTVTVPLSGVAKYTVSVGAYTGVDSSAPGLTFARSTSVTPSASRATPTVTAPDGAWVISYWADRSGTTTAWTPDASVATRKLACAADGGRICSALADSGAAVSAGSYGNVVATTNAPSDVATMWSIVLPPAS